MRNCRGTTSWSSWLISLRKLQRLRGFHSARVGLRWWEEGGGWRSGGVDTEISKEVMEAELPPLCSYGWKLKSLKASCEKCHQSQRRWRGGISQPARFWPSPAPRPRGPMPSWPSGGHLENGSEARRETTHQCFHPVCRVICSAAGFGAGCAGQLFRCCSERRFLNEARGSDTHYHYAYNWERLNYLMLSVCPFRYTAVPLQSFI